MIGQVVGSYRIVSELGKGGMGVVYRAEHMQLGRPAALKMLLPSLSTDPGIVQRFFNEARAASAIDHPGIVEIYDYGSHTDGSAYIVMALLKGESLEQRLTRAPITVGEGASILAQVAGALAAAHAKGIVHRDLKPDNIFLVPNELVPGGLQVVLLDFGIAKLGGDRVSGVKTQTGALMGTPAYMSPEQCMGAAEIDHRTDLYSLGCILFHVLCGRPPFLSEHGTGMMIAAHIRDAPPAPRSLQPALPEAIEAVVLRLLEKDPAARYQTASEVRAALRGFADDVPATWPPRADPALGYEATMPPPTSPEAYAATGVATTHTEAAAELTAPAQAASGRGALWIGGALLAAALVGAAVFLVLRTGGDGEATPAEVATRAPPADAAPAPAPTAIAAADAAAAPTATEPAPCADGQARTADTDGHCCWPEQAWSSSKARCVGTPRCPPGTRARRESCQPLPAPTDPPPPREPAASSTPRMRLDRKAYVAGAAIAVSFDRAISSTARDRAWVTVVEADKPDTTYGAWTYVADEATRAALEAPSRTGAYQVRLHTGYPAKRTNVVQRIDITVTGAVDSPPPAEPVATPRSEQRFTLASARVAPGEPVTVRFAAPLIAAKGERFWVTIVEADQPDSRYGPYEYVGAGKTSLSMSAPAKAGAYQVRLHANYPKKSTNVVHRADLTVE